MLISQKSHYALRAVFELAKHQGEGSVKIAAIAENQRIPQRFLEAILNQLKQSGLVSSRRGHDGGYMLAQDPQKISVAEILTCIQGPIDLASRNGPQAGREDVIKEYWKKIENSITTLFQKTSIQEFVQLDIERMERHVASYSI